MSPQTARVFEGLGAGVTRVWTLSSMLAQVILVMRAPFESQWAIGTQEGTHSSVDTLMDLETERDVNASVSDSFSLRKSLFIKMPLFDISPGAERSV